MRLFPEIASFTAPQMPNAGGPPVECKCPTYLAVSSDFCGPRLGPAAAGTFIIAEMREMKFILRVLGRSAGSTDVPAKFPVPDMFATKTFIQTYFIL